MAIIRDRAQIAAPRGQNMIIHDLGCETKWDNETKIVASSFLVLVLFCFFATKNLLIVAKKIKKNKIDPEATWPSRDAERRSLLSALHSSSTSSTSGCFGFTFVSLGAVHLLPPTPTSTQHWLRTTDLSDPKVSDSSADSGDRKSCVRVSSFLLFFPLLAAFIFV